MSRSCCLPRRPFTQREGAVQAPPISLELGNWNVVEKCRRSELSLFDGFIDDAGCKAHLDARIAAAPMAKVSEWLAEPPHAEHIGLLAAKIPDSIAMALDGSTGNLPDAIPWSCRWVLNVTLF